MPPTVRTNNGIEIPQVTMRMSLEVNGEVHCREHLPGAKNQNADSAPRTGCTSSLLPNRSFG